MHHVAIGSKLTSKDNRPVFELSRTLYKVSQEKSFIGTIPLSDRLMSKSLIRASEQRKIKADFVEEQEFNKLMRLKQPTSPKEEQNRECKKLLKH